MTTEEKGSLERALVAEIPALGNFAKKTSPAVLTPQTAKTLQVRGDAEASKRFIDHIAALVSKPDQFQFLKYLMELVLDNKLMEIKDAMTLAAGFRKHV